MERPDRLEGRSPSEPVPGALNFTSRTVGWREAGGICLRPDSLRSTVAVALLVGTVLFAINQLDVVVSGRADLVTWVKVGLTYLVPFLVSNYGILVASRQRT